MVYHSVFVPYHTLMVWTSTSTIQHYTNSSYSLHIYLNFTKILYPFYSSATCNNYIKHTSILHAGPDSYYNGSGCSALGIVVFLDLDLGDYRNFSTCPLYLISSTLVVVIGQVLGFLITLGMQWVLSFHYYSRADA